MSGYVDIPGDGEALARHALLLVVHDGGEAGRLLDGAEQVVLALGHEAAGLLEDALEQIIITINQMLESHEKI